MGKVKSWITGDLLWFLLLGFLGCIFFYKTVFFGLLPIPSDVLVGRYHPWKDALIEEYSRGFPYKNGLITDPIRQQIIWRKQAVDSWKNGELPGWDPYSFGGSPLDVNVQSGAFYPLNVFFLWFPFETAWGLLIMSQIFGYVWFTFAFFRELKIARPASFFGSIVAGFSGFSISWLTWGTMVSALMWLPILFLGIKKLSSKPPSLLHTIFWILMLMCSGYSTITAGHLQIAFYVIMATFFYWLNLIFRKKHTSFFYPLIAAIGTLLVLIKPTMAFMRFLATTVRGEGVAGWRDGGFFIPIRHLIQFVIPDYFGNPSTINYWGTWNYGELTGYIGILGILMAIVGGFYLWKRNNFWVYWVFICLLLSVNNPVAWFPYLLKIPFLSSLQPTRMLALTDFGLAVLSAYGFNVFQNKFQDTKNLIMKLSTMVLALIVLFVFWASIRDVFNFDHWGMVSVRNAAIPMFFILITLCVIVVFKQKNKLLFVAMTIILIADLFRFGWKFTPFTESRFLFPPTKILSYLQSRTEPFRVIVLDTETAPPNSLAWYGIETLGGYNPIYKDRYARFIHLFENGYSENARLHFQRLFDPSNFKSPLMGISNVQYALTINPEASISGYLLMQEGDTYLLEKETLPRWYFADSINVFNDSNSVLVALSTNILDGFPAYIEES
ncbi:MAG: hypothetical protein PHQ20_04995, partial [Candidatus Moranbacteria bacterium]|nr:hypothetical protein [Candidatus Moranbacteria bacterium]